MNEAPGSSARQPAASEGRTRRRLAIGALLTLAGFLVAAVVLAALLPGPGWVASFDVPGDDAFFVYAGGDELSHLALYHDIGDSIANARAADILFVGNSRMPLGLREEAIVAAARDSGLRVFSLALGHSSRARLAIDLIRRHDLRPPVVVAVGGPNYYADRLSERSAAVVAMTGWQARRAWIEAQASWWLRRLLHTWLPKLDLLGNAKPPDWVIYRSEETGWWRAAVEPATARPVRWARERADYRRQLPLARELRDEVESRGGRLVLSMVPHSATQSGHLPYLAEELGVAAVLPSVEDLATSDGSHLTRDSGTRYAQAFWRELMQVSEVRAKLGLAAVEQGGELAHWAAVRAATREMRSLLEDYYGGTEVLRQTWYLQPGDPRYDEGIGFLADKLARALVWRDRFVIGTIGSSVTAGYDNCHYDTYQKQLERLMAPLWKAAGVDFAVRNSGQGGVCGDSFENQVWCLRTLVGDDVDLTQYSWSYFESGHKPKALARYHEMFYRWSLLMEHSPVPQLVYISDCSQLSARDVALLDTYGRYGADVLCMQRGLRAAGYPGKKWREVGDGLHETTRYGDLPGVDSERRRSLGVVFRNWHPGPLLFQTTADAIAYKLSDALLVALDRIAAEPQPKLRWPRRPRRPPRGFLPEPVACPAEWCAVDEPPRCTNLEVPTFGEQSFARLAADAAGNPHAGLAEAGDGDWTPWQATPDQSFVPRAEEELEECPHPNRCGGWVAAPAEQAGWLTFRMPDLQLGYIAVCCAQKKCGQRMLAAGARFLLDGEPPASAPQVVVNSKCVVVQERFEQPGKRRTVHLGIRVPARDEPIPAISHVIGM